MYCNVPARIPVLLRAIGRPIDAGGTDFLAGGWFDGIDGWDTLVGGFDGI